MVSLIENDLGQECPRFHISKLYFNKQNIPCSTLSFTNSFEKRDFMLLVQKIKSKNFNVEDFIPKELKQSAAVANRIGHTLKKMHHIVSYRVFAGVQHTNLDVNTKDHRFTFRIQKDGIMEEKFEKISSTFALKLQDKTNIHQQNQM